MRKHSGWYKNYLLFAQKTHPYDFDGTNTTISNILVNKSLNTRIIPQLRSFALQHRNYSIYTKLLNVSCILSNYASPYYPVKLGMSIFFNLNLLRSLALRQQKIKRMLRGYPIRGQRRWSNASTAKRCCLFFKQSIAAYERELWGYKSVKKRRNLTKLDEARFSARHRVIKKKKFVTKKIKSRKELILRRKKRKKTPWR